MYWHTEIAENVSNIYADQEGRNHKLPIVYLKQNGFLIVLISKEQNSYSKLLYNHTLEHSLDFCSSTEKWKTPVRVEKNRENPVCFMASTSRGRLYTLYRLKIM